MTCCYSGAKRRGQQTESAGHMAKKVTVREIKHATRAGHQEITGRKASRLPFAVDCGPQPTPSAIALHCRTETPTNSEGKTR